MKFNCCQYLESTIPCVSTGSPVTGQSGGNRKSSAAFVIVFTALRMIVLYLMNPLFDIEKIRRNRAFALDNMDGHAFLFEKAAERMEDNLRDITREFENILIIGQCGAQFLQDIVTGKSVTVWDIDEDLNEIPSFEDESFDCVLSLHYLHVVNEVPAFLTKVKRMLQSDGLFLCSFFGGRSLQELRAVIMEVEMEVKGGVTQQIHPMIDHYQMAGLLQQAGFALPVVDYDRITVHYQSLETFYQDLRCMGERNALSQREEGIHNISQHIETQYKKRFYEDGYVATFDLVHAIGWAPHESQQKPAQRGSGDISLTEVL